MAENYESDAMRILLIGRTGQGKSSTGNSIIGSNIFGVSDASTSQTKTCEWSKKHNVFGRTVEVVDTPGFFDTEQDNASIHKELVKSLALTTPGFHAIAYVLKHGEKITKEHKETQALFFDWFGPGVEQYTFVILTHCKTYDEKHRYLKYKPQAQLTDLIEKCGERVVHIDNSGFAGDKENQVKSILDTVDDIRAKNGNHFTNVVFQLAEAYIRNKGPRELTKDSILILTNAGLKMSLSPEHYAKLENVLGRKCDSEISPKSDFSSTGDTDEESGVLSDSLEEIVSPEKGNVLLIDNATDQQIPNTHKVKVIVKKHHRDKSLHDKMHTSATNYKQQHYSLEKQNAVLSEKATNTKCSLNVENEIEIGSNMEESDELASEIYEETGRQQQYGAISITKKRERHRTASSTDEEQNDGYNQIESSTNVSRKQFKPNRLRRKDREVDIKTVQFTPHDYTINDQLNQYKEEVNSDDKKLSGLTEYIKKAWDFCKKTIKACSIS